MPSPSRRSRKRNNFDVHKDKSTYAPLGQCKHFIGKKKVLILTGDFTDNNELFGCYVTLLSMGIEVDIVSPGISKGKTLTTAVHIHGKESPFTYTETQGYPVKVTKSLDKVKPPSYSGIIIPGGRAPEYIRNVPKAVAIVKYFLNKRMPVGAICHGPQLVIAAGVTDCRMSGSETIRKEVECQNKWVQGKVVVDDKTLIITSPPYRLPEFLNTYLSILSSCKK